MPVHLDNARHQRHRSRGAHVLDIVRIALLTAVVKGPPGLHIGADHIELHRILLKGLRVKGELFKRHLAIGKVLVIEVACQQEGSKRAVARVRAVFQIIAEHAPRLIGLIVATEHSARGSADGALKDNFIFQEDIRDPRGKEPAHATAFHDQSTFHSLSFPCKNHTVCIIANSDCDLQASRLFSQPFRAIISLLRHNSRRTFGSRELRLSGAEPAAVSAHLVSSYLRENDRKDNYVYTQKPHPLPEPACSPRRD